MKYYSIYKRISYGRDRDGEEMLLPVFKDNRPLRFRSFNEAKKILDTLNKSTFEYVIKIRDKN